jgi:uncharacterized protein YkwD
VLEKKHILSILAAVFVALAVTAVAGAAGRAASPTTLLRAVNRARAAHGLRRLRIDATLARAARSHSLEMLRGGYFAHGDFGRRMTAFHVLGPTAGENLAWGDGTYATPGSIVAEWLASPEHRANLLRPGFARVGIGLARGTFLGNGGATVVTADFAGR